MTGWGWHAEEVNLSSCKKGPTNNKTSDVSRYDCRRGKFLVWGKDTRAKSTGPVLIQNLLILSTIQKISGKQREVLVVPFLFTAGRRE